MSNDNRNEFHRKFEELPMEVFELGDAGLSIESLTEGHGMIETGASCTPCICACSCCT
ncbi:thiomuracin/GE37468 family thiazolyl RiPP peptide [Nocardia sp. NPDC055053]